MEVKLSELQYVTKDAVVEGTILLPLLMFLRDVLSSHNVFVQAIRLCDERKRRNFLRVCAISDDIVTLIIYLLQDGQISSRAKLKQ